MKIYTKTGDAGKTGLFGGARISKDDIRIEAYGTVDELNSFIGLLISKMGGIEEEKELLLAIQSKLFSVGSNLASDPSKNLQVPKITEEDIEVLELAMDNMEANLEPLKSFVLPGGSEENSLAHVCRTITRRAERRVVTLSLSAEVDPLIIKYLNRLSDYFFMLSRYLAHYFGHRETPWTPNKES